MEWVLPPTSQTHYRVTLGKPLSRILRCNSVKKCLTENSLSLHAVCFCQMPCQGRTGGQGLTLRWVPEVTSGVTAFHSSEPFSWKLMR